MHAYLDSYFTACYIVCCFMFQELLMCTITFEANQSKHPNWNPKPEEV